MVTSLLVFLNVFSRWVQSSNLSREKIKELIQILKLKGINDLPIVKRTLVSTPRSTKVVPLDGGSFVYLGIENQILSYLKNNSTSCNNIPKVLQVQLNVDGFILSDKSNYNFWPLQILLSNLAEHPFLIACYMGVSKPNNVENYLNDFVKEFIVLEKSGFMFENQIIKLQFEALICDAPARAFICMTKGHNFTYGCHKCLTKSSRLNNIMSYRQTRNLILRNDNTQDFGFFVGSSLLNRIKSLNMFSRTPLDCMHVVYLGVAKRFLVLLKQQMI